MAVFWSLSLYSLIIALMMEAGSTSETSVNFYETTQRNVFILAAVRTRNFNSVCPPPPTPQLIDIFSAVRTSDLILP
jgi:hypothetical protein